MKILNFMNFDNLINEKKIRNVLTKSHNISHRYFEDQCLQRNINLNLTKASVLIPLIIKDDEIEILLTNRSALLEDHASQISFPGGRIDNSDNSPVDTAIRESYEEVGIEKSRVEVLGSLDVYQTGTGFRIIPIAGIIKGEIEYNINQTEVDSVFHLPLQYLMDEKNHSKEIKTFKGNGGSVDYNFDVIQYKENYIWGATAGMLINLYHLLK